MLEPTEANKQANLPRKNWFTQLVTYGVNPFRTLAYAQAEEYQPVERAVDISTYKDECLVAALGDMNSRNQPDNEALYGWSISSSGGWVRLTSEPCPAQ